ncbi:disease resistance At4g27190-like [Olea europaea subsp. europaea]|uniref:Disease resistance At4g27190-like n=1 Tax=Olea europaea subsp. europaea TaxID=158383 RepID=A0A8S0S5C3_OLEEU|nr:disease resistance At4g27190-like [Olea europaea subsp. europaea]
MDALKDKDVNIIGISGMGGVGKTTMAKEIVKEAEANRLFEEFAWADISRDPTVTKIQDELDERLSLNIKDITNESVRARRLRKRLGSDRSKSILVILDDLWEDTVLGKIEIPSAGYNKGLKILLTSRNNRYAKRWELKASALIF